MIAAIERYAKTSGLGPKFDLSVGFVDIVTGQQANYDGLTRHIALSTFKGPLGAYYLWLVEQGKLAAKQEDARYLISMMARSDNESTSCVFKRVGGLAGYNDWLAVQGLSRENNFVARWQNWGCSADKEFYLLPIDSRYFTGDKALGIPGGAWLHCYPDPRHFECQEAFSPAELALLYAKLYRGDVLNADHTKLWLYWIKKDNEDVALVKNLTAAQLSGVTAYAKNGFSARNDEYPVNFQHEAGVFVTPYGAYALAVFTQGNPDWPGTEPLGTVGKMVYDYFVEAHSGR
jgi:hypothetical protein